MPFNFPSNNTFDRVSFSPNELPSRALARVQAEGSEKGRDVSINEARQIMALLRHYRTHNKSRFFTPEAANREEIALKEIKKFEGLVRSSPRPWEYSSLMVFGYNEAPITPGEFLIVGLAVIGFIWLVSMCTNLRP